MRKLDRKHESTVLQLERDREALEVTKLERGIKAFEYRKLLRESGQDPENLNAIESRIVQVLGPLQKSDGELVLSCVISAVQVTARSSCISDGMGDIIFTFTGGKSGNLRGPFKVSLTLNVNCTNYRDGEGALDAEWLPAGRPGTVVRGCLLHRQAISFDNIMIEEPGGARSTQYKIRNVRVNASQVSHSLFEKRASAFSGTVFAFCAFESMGLERRPPAVTNDMIVLARPVMPSVVSRHRPYVYSPSAQGRLVLSGRAGVKDPVKTFPAVVRITEGYSGAFRTLEEECGGVESAHVDSGTRVLIRFFGVPQNIRLFVSITDVPGESATRADGSESRGGGDEAPWLALVSGADSNGAGGRVIDELVVAGDRAEIAEVHLSGGFGFAVWEWIAPGGPRRNPREGCLGISFESTATGDDVEGRSSTLACTLAPLSTVTVAGSAPVPRFIDLAGDPAPFFCQLGPFLDEE